MKPEGAVGKLLVYFDVLGRLMTEDNGTAKSEKRRLGWMRRLPSNLGQLFAGTMATSILVIGVGEIREQGREKVAAQRDVETREAASVAAFQLQFSQKEPVGAVLLGMSLPGVAAASRDFSGAILTGADLSGADLVEAVLANVDLVDADLTTADLSDANLSGSRLNRATLNGASLTGADLSEVDLTEAQLLAADLEEANLRGAILTDALLTGAILSGADLSNADLSGADLTLAKLDGIIWNAATVWPDEFEPPLSS